MDVLICVRSLLDATYGKGKDSTVRLGYSYRNKVGTVGLFLTVIPGLNTSTTPPERTVVLRTSSAL